MIARDGVARGPSLKLTTHPPLPSLIISLHKAQLKFTDHRNSQCD